MSSEFKKTLANVRNSLTVEKIEKLCQFGLSRRRFGFGGSHSVATYPPAAALREGVRIKPYDIAGGLEEPLVLDLYIHYPFCEWLCHFCHYSIRIEGDSLEVGHKTVEGIINEIQHWVECFEDAGRKPVLGSVYIGGGTGLVMPYDSLNLLMERLTAVTSEMGKPLHLCMEASSSSLCRKDARKKLSLLKEYGLDRISIGVQTLDDEILRTQGRGKGRENKYVTELRNDTAKATAIADHAVLTVREYTEDINIDFMQELSGSYTDATLEKDLDWFISRGLSSLTLYVTRYNPGSRAYQAFASSLEATPQFTHKSISRRIAAQELLKLAGYIDKQGGRFVKPEIRDIYKESRCSHVGRLLGVGPSAYSRLDSHFFRNEPEPTKWLGIVNRTASGMAQQHFITDSESAEGELMNLLRCGGSIPQFNQCLRETSDEQRFQSQIEFLLRNGIIQEQDGNFQLMPLGRALEEEVVWLFYSEKNRQLSEKMYPLT